VLHQSITASHIDMLTGCCGCAQACPNVTLTLHFYFVCVFFKFEFFKYSLVVNVKEFSYNFCFSLFGELAGRL
jgi:hypothetical protein